MAHSAPPPIYKYNAEGPDEGPNVEDPDAYEAALLIKARDRPWVLTLTASSVASFVALLQCLFSPDWVSFMSFNEWTHSDHKIRASLLNRPSGEAYAMLGLGATASLLLILNVVILAWLGQQTPTPRQRASVMFRGAASAVFAWLFVLLGLVVYVYETRHLYQRSFGVSFEFAWAVCACLAFNCAAWLKMARQAHVDCDSDLELAAPATCMEMIEDPDAYEAALLIKARDRPWVLTLTASSVASFVALLQCLFTPENVAFTQGQRGKAHAVLGLGATASLLLILNVVILAWLGQQTPTPRQRASVMFRGATSAVFAWLFVLLGLVVYVYETRHDEWYRYGVSFGFAWAVCACLAFNCAAWLKMAHQAHVDCRRCPHEDRMHEQIPDSDLELAAPAICMEITETIQPMAQKLGASIPRIPPATIQRVLFEQGYVSFEDLLTAQGGLDGAEILGLFEGHLELKPPELRRVQELLRGMPGPQHTDSSDAVLK